MGVAKDSKLRWIAPHTPGRDVAAVALSSVSIEDRWQSEPRIHLICTVGQHYRTVNGRMQQRVYYTKKPRRR